MSFDNAIYPPNHCSSSSLSSRRIVPVHSLKHALVTSHRHSRYPKYPSNPPTQSSCTSPSSSSASAPSPSPLQAGLLSGRRQHIPSLQSLRRHIALPSGLRPGAQQQSLTARPVSLSHSFLFETRLGIKNLGFGLSSTLIHALKLY
jgi:hypothetical protein